MQDPWPKTWIVRFVAMQTSPFGGGLPTCPMKRNGRSQKRGATYFPAQKFCGKQAHPQGHAQGEKRLVRSRGLEPPRVAPLAPQASASTNSATTAAGLWSRPKARHRTTADHVTNWSGSDKGGRRTQGLTAAIVGSLILGIDRSQVDTGEGQDRAAVSSAD